MKWSVMDRETRAVIERERGRYEQEDRAVETEDERRQRVAMWERRMQEAREYGQRVVREQDRQAGADEQETETRARQDRKQ